MLIMLLQVSGGAEGHRREGKHGADAHEPEDQREHAQEPGGRGEWRTRAWGGTNEHEASPGGTNECREV